MPRCGPHVGQSRVSGALDRKMPFGCEVLSSAAGDVLDLARASIGATVARSDRLAWRDMGMVRTRRGRMLIGGICTMQIVGFCKTFPYPTRFGLPGVLRWVFCSGCWEGCPRLAGRTSANHRCDSRSCRCSLTSAERAGGEDEACGVEYRVNDDAHRSVPPPLHNPREHQRDRQQHHDDRPTETPVEQAPRNAVSQPCCGSPGCLLTRQDITAPAQFLSEDIGNKQRSPCCEYRGVPARSLGQE